jgi:hypothetical protein
MQGQAEILSLLRLMRPQQSVFHKIRVGTKGDGGYVLPNDLQDISAVISLGIGGNASFDHYFAERSVPIFQYDHTIEGPPITHENFHFHKIEWAGADGPNSASLENMLLRHNLLENNDIILKFDTEGAEWNAFGHLQDNSLKYFRIIVCELHSLHHLQKIEFLQNARNVLMRLTRDHTVVHLHANNCCGITLIEGVPVPTVVELTLLRNDRSDFSTSKAPIPGPLDYPSMSDRPDIVLTPFS